jgi:hypothetical protein
MRGTIQGRYRRLWFDIGATIFSRLRSYCTDRLTLCARADLYSRADSA